MTIRLEIKPQEDGFFHIDLFLKCKEIYEEILTTSPINYLSNSEKQSNFRMNFYNWRTFMDLIHLWKNSH